jgi:hypothetical protein
VTDDNEPSLDDGTDLPDLPDLGEPTGPEGPAVGVEPDEGGGAGRRLAGVLGLVLGLLGLVLALVLTFLSLRQLFTASSAADRAMDPITAAVDRLEDRIDQTDDLIDREGVEADRVPELRARVDGLVDVTSLANRAFQAADDHPLHRLLPADLASLGESLSDFEASARLVDESLGSATTVRPAAARAMADEIDAMQAAVTDTGDQLDGATSSLRTWLRIAGLVGFLVSLWLFWAQRCLFGRGWRGLRNREP